MRIRISRDSVAAGDDVDPHDHAVDAEGHTPLDRLVADLVASHYLPSIRGDEATWVLRAGRRGRFLGVVAQQWSAPRMFGPELREIAALGNALHFEYRTQEDPAAVFDELSRHAGADGSDVV